LINHVPMLAHVHPRPAVRTLKRAQLRRFGCSELPELTDEVHCCKSLELSE
jgi:hypothetical protein